MASLTFLTIALAACSGGGGSLTPSPVTGTASQTRSSAQSTQSRTNLDGYISPSLSQTEQAIMRNVLADLRPQDRNNVVFFSLDGKIHTNRPELLAIASITKPMSMPDDNTGIAATSEQPAGIPAPIATPTANPANFTGPFFRRNATWGYSAEQATVTLPNNCGDTHVQQGDASDYYLGGATFQSKQPGKNGLLPQIDEVDAGLQMLPHTFGGQPMSLQLFMKDGQSGNTGVLSPPSNAHVACDGAPFTMTYYVSNPTLLTLTLAGDIIQGVSPLTMTVQVNASSGWTSTCGLCILKRIASIAVPKGNVNPDGSFFGINGSAQPLVAISDAMIGNGPSSITTQWPTSFPNGVAWSTSPFAPGEPYICTSTSSPGNDLVGIDWQQKSASCSFAPGPLNSLQQRL